MKRAILPVWGVLAMAASSSWGGESQIPVLDTRTSFVERVTFSSERTGIVAAVPEEGEKVLPRDVVVRLKDDVPQAVLAVAEARALSEIEIRVAEKSAEAARAELEAALQANLVSQPTNPAFPATHITRLRLSSEAGVLQVEQKDHERNLNALTRDQAQAELETFRIVSDIGGTVTRVYKRRGEGVQQGESIVQVVNTDRLRVEGYVTVENLFLIRTGMPVQVTFDLPETAGDLRDREFTGALGFIDVAVQPLSRLVRVWAEIDNSEGLLREGFSATMTIQPPPR